jgi:hypothetical protein
MAHEGGERLGPIGDPAQPGAVEDDDLVFADVASQYM